MEIRHHMTLDRSPMTPEEFLANTPARSIALDGAVVGPYFFDSKGPRVNFNHHEGCPRLPTRATCAQVLMYARMGLYRTFANNAGVFDVDIWMNDCDADVCTSSFILENPAICRQVINPRLNKLVGMEDMLDTTAGFYPYPPDLEGMEELNHVFEPYWNFRLSGAIDRRRPAEFLAVIDDVHLRIKEYLYGTPHRKPLDTRYEVLDAAPGWQLVREIGSQARAGIFASGVEAFIAMRERPDQRFVYTFCRLSDMVSWPIELIYRWMNELEGCTGTDTFGGGNTVGGSPRFSGSRTPPRELVPFIAGKLREWDLAGRPQ